MKTTTTHIEAAERLREDIEHWQVGAARQDIERALSEVCEVALKQPEVITLGRCRVQQVELPLNGVVMRAGLFTTPVQYHEPVVFTRL